MNYWILVVLHLIIQNFVLHPHWRTRQNFFVKKNIKLVELSRFAHTYNFHAWSNGVHDFAKPVVWQKNKKYAHYLYCIGFRLTEHFIFFFISGDEKKISEFFTAIFGPKLNVIIINNYWTKHNIEKPYRIFKVLTKFNEK